jgi:hypothetical protein
MWKKTLTWYAIIYLYIKYLLHNRFFLHIIVKDQEEIVNVVWIIADTLRKDALGVYGNQKITHRHWIASQQNRYDSTAITPPIFDSSSRADFLTGRWTMSICIGTAHENEVTLPQLLPSGDSNLWSCRYTLLSTRGMNYDRGFKIFLKSRARNVRQ